MQVEIITEKIGAGVVLKLKGDVDMNTSSDVRSAIGVYMDSSGIATLVEGMQNCMKKGIRLRLFELSPQVRDVFELARLASVFEIYPTKKEAVTDL
jgi:anti-sigma B factor antagonist